MTAVRRTPGYTPSCAHAAPPLRETRAVDALPRGPEGGAIESTDLYQRSDDPPTEKSMVYVAPTPSTLESTENVAGRRTDTYDGKDTFPREADVCARTVRGRPAAEFCHRATSSDAVTGDSVALDRASDNDFMS